MPLREIGGVCGKLVCNYAFFNVLFIRQTEMLFRRDITQHCCTKPADHRRSNAARNMVVARSNVCRQRPERVEWRLTADLKLLVHVLFDQVHRNVSRPLDHRLAIHLPRDLGQLTKRIELGKLGFVISVGDRSGP